MSKKYYIMLARLIKDNTANKNGMGWAISKSDFVRELCVELKKDNSLFDSNRFLFASGCCKYKDKDISM